MTSTQIYKREFAAKLLLFLVVDYPKVQNLSATEKGLSILLDWVLPPTPASISIAITISEKISLLTPPQLKKFITQLFNLMGCPKTCDDAADLFIKFTPIEWAGFFTEDLLSVEIIGGETLTEKKPTKALKRVIHAFQHHLEDKNRQSMANGIQLQSFISTDPHSLFIKSGKLNRNVFYEPTSTNSRKNKVTVGATNRSHLRNCF